MSIASKKKALLPTFLVKLLKMLDDDQCQDYIAWIATYDGFEIFNTQQFTSNVLPKYFKHQNFSSFVRQLNTYGFNKVRAKQNQNIYQNPFFKKGKKISFKKIQKKPHDSSEQSEIVNNQKQTIDPLMKNLSEIKEKQNELSQKFRNAFEKNNRIFTQNKSIILDMGKCSKHEQTFIFGLLQTIKSSKKNSVVQTLEGESATGQKSVDSFDIKYKQQSSTLEGSANSFRRIQQFLHLSQFEQIQLFGQFEN